MELTLRKTYRAQLTKLSTTAGELLSSDRADLNEITVLVSRVTVTQDNLSALNEKLADSFKEEQYEAECVKIVEYDDLAATTIARLECRAKQEQRPNNGAPENNVGQPCASAGENGNGGLGLLTYDNVHTRPSMQVRLPKLDLIQFGGDIESCPAFWE